MFQLNPRKPMRPAQLKQRVPKTTPIDGDALATQMVNRNAVKFGEELRRDTGKAYPFFYSFVPYPFLDTAYTNYGSPAVITTVVQGGEGPDGYDIPGAAANGDPGMRDIYIRTDRDLNFDLLEVRYSVRAYEYASQHTDSAYYTALSDVFTQEGFPRLGAYPVKHAVPHAESIRVSVYIASGMERSIYGGNTFINRQGDKSFEEVPVPVTNLQGTAQGKNSLRTPYLIAKQGVVKIRIRNFSTTEMVVNGYLFGYKVAY